MMSKPIKHHPSHLIAAARAKVQMLLSASPPATAPLDPTKFCYWSIGDGQYAHMVQALVHSARAAGVTQEIHAFTDRPILGAHHHPAPTFKKELYLFKLEFLRNEVAKLDYDYFVFLDADCFFVRNPGEFIAGAVGGNRCFVQMESDCTSPRVRRDEWWQLRTTKYVELVRILASKPLPHVYNSNAGFWIVRRDSIGLFCDLAMLFWETIKDAVGVELTEEAPIAFAGHVLQAYPCDQALRKTHALWASDWTGQFASGIPDGLPWLFEDYMTGEKIEVNPAIVHAMRIDAHLVKYAMKRTPRSPAAPKPAKPLPEPVPVESWPSWAIWVSKAKSDHDAGVGDTVSRHLGIAGKAFIATIRAMGADCGCSGRRKTWNAMFPYLVPTPVPAAV